MSQTPNQSDPDIVIPVPVFPPQTDSGDARSGDLSRPIVDWSREVFNASGGAKNKSELLRKLGQVLNSTGCLALWIIKREADEEMEWRASPPQERGPRQDAAAGDSVVR